jgi:hypothetical protein
MRKYVWQSIIMFCKNVLCVIIIFDIFDKILSARKADLKNWFQHLRVVLVLVCIQVRKRVLGC